MSVPFNPNASTDDADLRERKQRQQNPYSNDRLLKREDRTKSKDSLSSDQDPVFKARQDWANKNLPPLEYLSLSFSTYLLVLMTLNFYRGLDTVYTCVMMSRGGYFYFTFDSLLEIAILNRFKFILHHAIALVVFGMVGHVQLLQKWYPLETIGAFMPILAWFEVSTVLLNIRSLIKEYVFNVRKKSNSLAEATFTQGSLDNANPNAKPKPAPAAAAANNLKMDIVPSSSDPSAATAAVARRELIVELFFIVSYGGIRLVIAPYLLLTRGFISDPLVIMGLVLCCLSAQWVWDWVKSTQERYYGLAAGTKGKAD